MSTPLPPPVPPRQPIINPAVNRHSQKRTMIALAAGALTAIAACAYFFSETGNEGQGGNPLQAILPQAEPDHAERELVRAWLKENTNSGEWEEVRWWRFTDYDGGILNGGVAKSVRVKYRTETPFGGKVLNDRYFGIRDGKIFEYMYDRPPPEMFAD